MHSCRRFSVSEKKLEHLKRAKERRLKEEQLRLDNQIAETEDVVKLVKNQGPVLR